MNKLEMKNNIKDLRNQLIMPMKKAPFIQMNYIVCRIGKTAKKTAKKTLKKTVKSAMKKTLQLNL